MAVLKISDRTYMTPRDLYILMRYVINPNKVSLVYSNMLYYTEPYDANCSLLAAQWQYNHQYFCQMGKTLAYHYVLGFEPGTDSQKLSSHSALNIMEDICSLDCFRNINLLMGIHKKSRSEFDHIHILADTVNKITGKRLYIPRESLINQFGDILICHQIPLIGYFPRYCPIRFSS